MVCCLRALRSISWGREVGRVRVMKVGIWAEVEGWDSS